MQITTLIQVINHLKKLSGDSPISEDYRKLSEILKKAAEEPEGDYIDDINLAKGQLYQILHENEPLDWDFGSLHLLDKIDVNGLFGNKACLYLDSITLTRKNYKNISVELNKRIKLISRLSEDLNRFTQLLELILPQEVYSIDNETDKSSLYLYFEGQLSVNNISDLERYARIWDGILSAFSRLCNEREVTLDISNFNKGNIVLGVKTEDSTLIALMKGVNGILSSMPSLLKMRKIQFDLSQLDLNSNISFQIEEEIQNMINKNAFLIAQSLIHDISSSDDAETITVDISRCLKQILSFIEKGGRIEFNPSPAFIDGHKIRKEIIESYSVANQLEKIFNNMKEAEVI